MVTPVDPRMLEYLLRDTNYDTNETEFLVKGFTDGFTIGYQGNKNVQMESPNLKFRGIGNETVLWNKVMKEVREKRYAGPFSKPPFKNYIQSPIGLVDKDGGKDTRLIFHLSYPRDGTSVNANTPEEWCKVRYPDFSKAIKLCMYEGKFCYIARSDMKSAFRNLGLLPEDYCWLLMKAKNPIDGKIYWFVDKCLPFGGSISCSHFQRFSNGVAHIVSVKTGKDLVNYLDDFLFAALLKAICDGQVDIFLKVCGLIGFPVNMEKTFWGATTLTFLGMLIDMIQQTVMVPAEKIETALNLIDSVLNKKSGKLTLLQLQKICGFLNFLCRCVTPGRAFTRRLYYNTSGKLKPHHHIRIKNDMKEDLLMWRLFLKHPSVYSRCFMDFTSIGAYQIEFYTDASGENRTWWILRKSIHA